MTVYSDKYHKRLPARFVCLTIFLWKVFPVYFVIFFSGINSFKVNILNYLFSTYYGGNLCLCLCKTNSIFLPPFQHFHLIFIFALTPDKEEELYHCHNACYEMFLNINFGTIFFNKFGQYTHFIGIWWQVTDKLLLK